MQLAYTKHQRIKCQSKIPRPASSCNRAWHIVFNNFSASSAIQSTLNINKIVMRGSRASTIYVTENIPESASSYMEAPEIIVDVEIIYMDRRGMMVICQLQDDKNEWFLRKVMYVGHYMPNRSKKPQCFRFF